MVDMQKGPARTLGTRGAGTYPLLVLLASLASCDGSSPIGSGVPIGGGGGGGGDPVPTNAVSVEDPFFSPALISVARGDVVVWTWNGGLEHNVTWVSGDLANSPTQSDGSHEVMMPSMPRLLGYYCTIHGTPSSGMQGTIIVQ